MVGWYVRLIFGLASAQVVDGVLKLRADFVDRVNTLAIDREGQDLARLGQRHPAWQSLEAVGNSNRRAGFHDLKIQMKKNDGQNKMLDLYKMFTCNSSLRSRRQSCRRDAGSSLPLLAEATRSLASLPL